MKFLTVCLLTLTTLSIAAQTFNIGSRTITFTDPSRSNRAIATDIVYPGATAGANAVVAIGKFPVVVFGHGFVMETTVYKTIFDSLAALGYICALPKTEGALLPAPSHTDFGKDLAFVLDELLKADTVSSSPFLGRVNGKGAIGGHSMGGGCTFLADQFTNNAVCYFTMAPANTNPPSIAAAKTIAKPMCILSGTRDCVAGYAAHQKPMYDSLVLSPCKQLVSITDARHCSFSDGSSFNCNFGEGTSGCASSPLTTAQQLTIIRRIMIPYFNYFLKGVCSEWDVYQNYITTTSALTTLQSCTMDVPQFASISGDSAFCSGGSANLEVLPTGFNYTWSNNATAQSISVNQAGNFTVNVANDYCSISSLPFSVAEKLLPSAPSLQQNSNSFCSNSGNLTLLAQNVADADYYIWSAPSDWTVVSDDSSTSLVINSGSTGTFYVTAANECGESPADSIEVSVTAQPTLSGTVSGTATICSNAPLEQSFSINGSFIGADSVRWSAGSWQILNGQGNNSASFLRNGLGDTISVYGINNCGVSATEFFVVTVLDTNSVSISAAGNTLTATAGFADYQWFRNDTLIVGAKSQTYEATTDGSYTVVATNNNSCQSLSNAENVTIVISDIEIAENVKIRLYPNPVSNSLFVDFSNNNTISKITVSDVNGKLVLHQNVSSNSVAIDVTTLSSGLYFVRFSGTDFVATKRFTVE